MLIPQNSQALDSQIRSVLNSSFGGKYRETSKYYNFRCNICGDSSNQRKRRAYILKDKQVWCFYCHNCNASIPVSKWLKDYFPTSYKDYVKDLVAGVKPKVSPKPSVVDTYNEKKDVDFFVPILKGSGRLFEAAIKFCESRLIPKEVYEKWFVATGGTFTNRLIIPYYNKRNKIYNWQARSLVPVHNKYIFRLGEHDNRYNYDFVDTDKEVIIFEGAIDSLSVKNAIGISGAGKAFSDNLKGFPHRYYIMDSDEKGRETSIKLLELGEHVFLWDRFIKKYNLPSGEKKLDMNDVMIYLKRTEKFSYEELKEFFTNSIYSKMEFLK